MILNEVTQRVSTDREEGRKKSKTESSLLQIIKSGIRGQSSRGNRYGTICEVGGKPSWVMLIKWYSDSSV